MTRVARPETGASGDVREIVKPGLSDSQAITGACKAPVGGPGYQ